MASLEDELNDAMKVGLASATAKIKAEGGELDERIGKLVERVIIPLLGAQRAAILRLAREVDAMRLSIDGGDLGD